MNYAEIIYETGAKSVISYDDLPELQSALKEQNDRALSGQPGAPQDQVERDDIDYSAPGMIHPNTARLRPAEHVKRVILYGDTHPADLGPTTISSETLAELFNGLKDDDGNVEPGQLTQAIRNEASPIYPVDQGAHRSMYKAPGTELDLGFLTPEAGES